MYIYITRNMYNIYVYIREARFQIYMLVFPHTTVFADADPCVFICTLG